MKDVLVFDVNETLLDLAALDPIFERIFGAAVARREWFSQFIQNALVATVTGAYSPFGEIGMAALAMIAQRRDVQITEDGKAAIRQGLGSLPPHPDVRAGLDQLKKAGFRLAALTNSTQAVAETQLKNAGLSDLFEHILSADAVKRLKPAPEPYHMAAQVLNVPIGQMCLIAAHAWDVTGAMRVGAHAAFVARPSMVLDPLAPTPLVVGDDIREVAAQLIHLQA